MKLQNFLSYIPVMKKTHFSVVRDQYQNKKLNIENKKKTVEKLIYTTVALDL